MSEWIKVAEVSELQPGECKTALANGREIGLFNVGGKFYAVDNCCPHQGGPLGEGILNDKLVTCPWHGWRFDVCTGKSTTIPSIGVDRFECVVDGTEVRVKIEGG